MILTSGRIAALAVGLPLVLGTATFGAFSMVGLYAHTSEHHIASYPWHGGDISLNTGSGGVRVVAGGGDTISVAYTEHYELKRPTVTTATLNGGLQLVGKCPGGLFGSNCYINYVLTVPASAQLVLHSGDGNLHIVGISGSEKLSTGAGGIQLDNVSGAITAHTGDGSIRGTQVGSHDVTASTGAGSVDLEWAVAPTAVAVSTGDGGITLVLPGGSGPYHVTTHTGDGGVEVAVPTDATSSSSIDARTGAGSIHIRTN
jgi:hypothetical protein